VRKVVLAMMTTLNGRLDAPDEFVTGVSEDHYREINRVLAHRRRREGRKRVAKGHGEKMHSYKKFVFTTDPELTFDWHNAEPVVVSTDDDVRSFVEDLKARTRR
jgi:hypothetical protein